MTQEQFNQEYMHYYLGSGVKYQTVNNSLLDLTPEDAYDMWLEFRDCEPNKITANVIMHLKALEDMTEGDAKGLINPGEKLISVGVKMDNCIFLNIEVSGQRKAVCINYKELSPDQLHHLLKFRYNLFDPKWEHTIKIER